MTERKYKVPEVAEMLGVTPVTIYRKLKKLKTKVNDLLAKEAGTVFLTEEAVSVIKEDLARRVSNDIESPAEEKKNDGLGESSNAFSPERETVSESEVSFLRNELARRDRTIDNLLGQLEEERRQTSERSHRSDSIIMNMSNQIKSQVMLLEDLRKDLDQVKQMKVEEVAKPAVKEAAAPIAKKVEKKAPVATKSFGTLYRTFLELFQPWKLREDAAEEQEAA